jgi:hypothetical protein
MLVLSIEKIQLVSLKITFLGDIIQKAS